MTIDAIAWLGLAAALAFLFVCRDSLINAERTGLQRWELLALLSGALAFALAVFALWATALIFGGKANAP